jgi:hypothetical protein
MLLPFDVCIGIFLEALDQWSGPALLLLFAYTVGRRFVFVIHLPPSLRFEERDFSGKMLNRLLQCFFLSEKKIFLFAAY